MLNKSRMNHTTFLQKDDQALGKNSSCQFTLLQLAEKHWAELMKIRGKEWKKERNIENTVNYFAYF